MKLPMLLSYALVTVIGASVCFGQDATDTFTVLPAEFVAEFSAFAPPMLAPVKSPPQVYELLANPSVQKDLELVDGQLKQILAMQIERSNEAVASMRDLRSGKVTGDEYTAQLVARRAFQRQKLDSILLPHQIERLAQISIQTFFEQAGTANAISSESVSKKLGITEEQEKLLKFRHKELEKKLAGEIAKLKQKAENELLNLLTPHQRERLKILTGPKFEYRPNNWDDALRSQGSDN